MKKTKNILFLLCIYSLAIAQPYGHTHYPNGSRMTSGDRTSFNPTNQGFIMAGMAGTDDIHIDKTSIGGVFSNPPGAVFTNHFQYHYKIIENPVSCLTGSGIVYSCIGVTAIELDKSGTGGSGPWYVMAGAYTDACFVTFLNGDGDVNSTIVYPFSGSATFLSVPLIVEDHGAGYLYVAGLFDSYMYVMQVDNTGAVQWSHYYDTGGTTFEPRAMILSPHNGDLVIVGHMNPDPADFPGRASDGFFISLDPTSGGVNAFKDYSSTPCNWFNAVAPAYSTAGGFGPGYVVGGYTDPFSITGGALMMKLDVGGNIVWNTLIESGTSGTISQDINGVVERYNAGQANYEYYGVAQTVDNISVPSILEMTIFKLDDSGNPFSTTGPPGSMDEFHYWPSSGPLHPKALTCITGQNPDEGLHIYGDNGNNHYLVESYFNGVSGCNDSFTNISATEPGPTDVDPGISLFGSLVDCTELTTDYFPQINTPTQICSANTLGSGSNAKSIPTQIAKRNKNIGFEIYPNPNNGEFIIRTGTEIYLKLVNELGQEIKYIQLNENNNYENTISHLSSGIYFVVGDGVRQKIVVNK